MDQQNEARPVEKVLKWRSFFITFLSVLWLFFALYVFPSFNYPDTLDGLKLLDLRFVYTPDDVALLFAQLGEEGRHTYFKQLLIADMFYPLIYSILLYQILLILLTATARRRFFLRLSVLPLLAGLADVLENLNIIGMLTSNPKITTAFLENSYKTADFFVHTGYPMTGIIEYTGNATDLFVDAAARNFRIKDVTFGGLTTAGDPRWRY